MALKAYMKQIRLILFIDGLETINQTLCEIFGDELMDYRQGGYIILAC